MKFLAKALFSIVFACMANVNAQRVIDVNTTFDGHDDDPGDGVCSSLEAEGQCTIRAAVEESNADNDLNPLNTIRIPEGNFILGTLMNGQMLEDEDNNNDIDISSSIRFEGAGSIGFFGGATIIRSPLDRGVGTHRIFDIRARRIRGNFEEVSVSLQDLALVDGFERGRAGLILSEYSDLFIHRVIMMNGVVLNRDVPGVHGDGGAILFIRGPESKKLEIQDSVFYHNLSKGKGGAIFAAQNDRPVGGEALFAISNSHFFFNFANDVPCWDDGLGGCTTFEDREGGVRFDNMPSACENANPFSPPASSGAVDVYKMGLSVSESTFIGNQGYEAGAISGGFSWTEIKDSEFKENVGCEVGGVQLYSDADIRRPSEISKTLFYQNQAISEARTEGISHLQLNAVRSNEYEDLFHHFVVSNSTFSEGRSPNAAIHVMSRADAMLIQNTIVNNEGFGLWHDIGFAGAGSAKLSLQGSIVAGNTRHECVGTGDFTSLGHNLILQQNPYELLADPNMPRFDCGPLVNTDIIVRDPLALGLRQDADVALRVPASIGEDGVYEITLRSPGLNHIPQNQCRMDEDQRGVERPFGGKCDVGAYEYDRVFYHGEFDDFGGFVDPRPRF